MQEAYQLVMKKSQDSALKQKKRYDKHVRTALLLPGDRVLIKNMAPVVAQVSLNHTGKRKFILLNPILEKIPQCTRFIQKVDIVVSRVLHRSMLLPGPELKADFVPCQSKIKNIPQKPTAVPKVYPENDTRTADIDYQEDGFDGLYPDG